MSVRSPRPDQHDEGDEDASLFGSPPPSPGRSPSPALALPLRSNGSNDNIDNKSGPSPLPHEVSTLANLNVGTIALPGSQPSSELFVNPLAPSLASLPTTTSLVNNAHRRTGSQSTTTSTGSSRTRQSTSTTAKPPRAKKRKVKSTTPRPQVQIPLPDPSGPVPPHFLRSQTGLLGLAGLVGGVNPSQLKLRGQTPTNPIVVEDEEGGSTAAPSVTKPPPKKKSRLVPGLSKEMRMLLKAAKPSEIPVPTKQDILAVLVKERDLTPIIQGLIKLGMDAQGRVAPSPQPVPPAPKEESSAFDGRPPAKKRRLSIVPAGANDWDVPYPFPEGQGPTSYQGSWKTERGKQLIDQLIELTKVASKKAAVQKFLKVKGIQLSNQAAQKSSAEVEIVNGHYKSRGQPPPPVVPTPTEGRINKYYKPITATYGLGVQRPPFPVAGSSRQSTPAASSSASQPHPKSSGASKQQRSSPVVAEASTADSVTQASTSSNASLPSSKEASPAAPEPASQEVQDFISSLLGVTNEQRIGKPSTEPSQDDNELFFGFNNDVFMQDDIFSNWEGTFSAPSTFSSSSATSITSTPDLDLSSFADFAFLSSHFGEPSMGMDPMSDLPAGTPAEASVDSASIAPELLGMSSTMASNNPLDDVFPLPDDFGVASPNSSISPFTGGPATPASADWDMTLPDVFAPQAMQDPLALPDFANMNVDPVANLQQSEQGGGGLGELEGWAALASLSKFGKVDGVDMGVFEIGAGIPAGGDAGQAELDLGGGGGGLVEPQEPQKVTELQQPAPVPTEQVTESAVALQEAPAAPTAYPEAPFASTAALQSPPPLPESQPSTQPSTSKVVAVPPQPTTSSKTSAPTKSKLSSQKEETIKRIKDRKAELEAELQKVKLQLWETTIEQGALGHVVQFYQEKEKENESHQRPISQTQTREQEEHIDSHTEVSVQGQVLAAIGNAPPHS